jgi:hypothetical protein
VARVADTKPHPPMMRHERKSSRKNKGSGLVDRKKFLGARQSCTVAMRRVRQDSGGISDMGCRRWFWHAACQDLSTHTIGGG